MNRALLVLALVLGATGVAHAYPQYQLVFDPTCTGCHQSPAGGNLLNENGLAVAESTSMFGTAPEFLNGILPTPTWLTLGGDLRASGGFIATPEEVLTAFPMQAELYANVRAGAFSVNVTGGLRPWQDEDRAATTLWSREHYAMWQSKPGESEGIYVRAGRFMPVFGLRVAEHPAYLRRYGGTPLFADTYGASASYVEQKFEVHATGFVEDPFIDPVVHGHGGAAYTEVRVTDQIAVGLEGMVRRTDTSTRYHAGVTGKYYLPAANLLLQAELQYTPLSIDDGNSTRGLLGFVMGTLFLPNGFMIDVALNHYDPNYRIAKLDRDSIDVNVHWFTTSHLELVLNNRYETLALGSGGRSGGYTLLQLHYRL